MVAKFLNALWYRTIPQMFVNYSQKIVQNPNENFISTKTQIGGKASQINQDDDKLKISWKIRLTILLFVK